MTFGQRLTQLRKENGYSTRNEFADKLGIPSTTLRNYETEAREPGHTFLKQISELFNVSIDYLLCLTDEKKVLDPFHLRAAEQDIIKKYRSLDTFGQATVNIILERELNRTFQLKKAERNIYSYDVVAAHERTDIAVTDEMRRHDDNIMDDDNF